MNLPITLQGLADFHRAFTGASALLENTSAIPSPVESRIMLPSRFGFAEMRRVPDELIKCSLSRSVIDQEFRKANHIHEQDIGDFELNFLLTSADIP